MTAEGLNEGDEQYNEMQSKINQYHGEFFDLVDETWKLLMEIEINLFEGVEVSLYYFILYSIL